MNILGLTQGANIDIFLSSVEAMRQAGQEIGRVGAVVSLADHYQSSPVVQDLAADIPTLKEWEIIAKALRGEVDLDDLQKRERDLSSAAVWKAIIGDRRLIYGKRAKFTQDYRVHFSDQQLWAIALSFLNALNDLLEEVSPDVVIGFTPVTFGELLALEVAKSRNIPTLQLHSSRIKNYFALHDQVAGTSHHFHELMEKGDFKVETLDMARMIVREARDRGLIYEGANKSIARGRRFDFAKIVTGFPKAVVKEILKFKDPITRKDHHDPGHLMPYFYTQILQPLKEKIIVTRIKAHERFVPIERLSDLGEYCFFPLQSEPEVSIQVLGRPYHKNQIELLRNLAASLPAGMKLLVKEHPRSLGLRPWRYYQTLFEIPNLYLADVHASSMQMVNQSKFIGVISGTIGFEAVMAGRPVLIFGHPKYADIPGNMMRKCYNLFELPNEIQDLLEGYVYDEDHIVQFVAALIEGSVAIDLYSSLLGKAGRYSFQGDDVSADDNVKALSNYMIKRIDEVVSNADHSRLDLETMVAKG